MRYPLGHRQKSRARILRAAAELFRGHGIAATGVDRVMARAGLTAGGFYAHFSSKERLVADAVDAAAQASRERWYGRFDDLRGHAWARALLDSYLSDAHRDDRAGGCILPSLGAEIAGARKPARLRFEGRVRGMFELFAARTEGALPADRPEIIGAIALCVGGLLLSRAVVTPALSREVLGAARTGAERLLGLRPPPPPKRTRKTSSKRRAPQPGGPRRPRRATRETA